MSPQQLNSSISSSSFKILTSGYVGTDSDNTPQSTGKSTPVIEPDNSEHKKTTAFATSSFFANSPVVFELAMVLNTLS